MSMTSGIFTTQNRATCAACSVLTILLSLVGVSYFAFGSSNKLSPKTLILTSVLFRHGDRTPTDFYPNDPYADLSYWPEGLGALTTKGKHEAFSLGEFFRERYQNFLPEIYTPEDLYVVSSDHDRCLMSAYLLLAGLYPPRGSQIWKEGMPWQPIPVHTTPRNLDQLIVVKKPCPRYDMELAQILNSTKLSPDEESTLNYLSTHAGKPIRGYLDAELLFNSLEIEEKRGLKLPSWTSSIYPVVLRDIAARSLALFTETPSLQRLKGGPLVKDIVSNMLNKISRKLQPDRKMFLYSGHDLTIVSLLRTLGVTDLIKPEPTAAVILELHRSEDGGYHYVEILYKNSSKSQDLYAISLSECPRPCTLKNFIEKTEYSTPVDYDEECQLATKSTTDEI